MLAVLEAAPEHGYQIALSVEERSGGLFVFQHGTLYPILHRLEAEAKLRGEWHGEGRRRKTYHITAAGRATLRAGAAELEEQFGVLLQLLGPNRVA